MANKRLFRQPTVYVFLAVSIIFGALRGWFESQGIDYVVVLAGNIILYGVSVISAGLYRKGMEHPNTNGFLRGLYSGMLLKLFVCIIAAFIYIYSVNGVVNKPALFICLFLYLLYTFLEIRFVMGTSRRMKENG